MQELFPITAGLLLGVSLQLLRPGLRIPVGVVAAVAIGVTATVISGEYKIGWEFLAIDIPGAALAAIAGFVMSKQLQRAVRRRDDWR